MSVLDCNRNGCHNIMCNRFSHEYGYICDNCFDELVESRLIDISAFMDSLEDGDVSKCRDEYRKLVSERFPLI
jgi:hypothetical protein